MWLWAFTVLTWSRPSATELETIQPTRGTRLYDDSGETISDFQAERRAFVPLAQIPKTLRGAILAVEDSRFYDHFGVDPRGLVRAISENVRHGRVVEGGSTITQQLAKVLFLTPERTLGRKLKEVVLALELERRYSKDRILEMYLNQIYFGHGSYGVEAAARTYFGKSVTALTLAEAALVAGLPRAPTLYSPFTHPESARERREQVLNRVLEVGVARPTEVARAMASGLGVLPPERRPKGQYFIEYVRKLLVEKYGDDMVFKSGLNVYTTLSPRLQVEAERALRNGLARLPGPSGVDRPEGAIVTIEPQTGYIKAMVGGSDFFRTEFNRASQARRQPGSAFKPFVYLAALEAGFTPATVIDDSPVRYPTGRNGEAWQPGNYDRKFRGPTTLQQGLEESINVVTVKLQERIGVKRTVDLARRLGIRSPLEGDLTIALGSSDLTLLELTSAYGALANQGLWVSPTPLRYVTDAQGTLLEEHLPRGRRAITPELAYVITRMLRGVVERGTGVGAMVLERPIAAKTGTTSDYSNAWFIGYTPTLATGVWVGYDRPKSLGKDGTGARVAVPIWVSYMGKALANASWEDFRVPAGVLLVPVDRDRSESCERPVLMAFLRGTEPATPCGGPPDVPEHEQEVQSADSLLPAEDKSSVDLVRS